MANKPYYNIVNNADGSTVIDIDGAIDSWGENSAKNLSNKIKELGKSASQITMRINSVGGEVFEGIAIVNAMNDSPAIITTHVVGLAASMAGVIALAGDHVKMSSYATLMLHKPHVMTWGQSEELREAAEMVDKSEDNLVNIIADKRNIDAQVVRDKFFQSKKDIWLNAEEAKEEGLIDEVQKLNLKNSIPQDFSKYSISAKMEFYSDAISDDSNNNKNPEIKSTMNKVMLSVAALTALSLSDKSSESEVNSAIENLVQENKALKAEKEKRINDEAEALIKDAVKDGKISADEKEMYMNLAKNDLTLAKNTIAKLPGKASVVDNLDTSSNQEEDRSNWNYSQWAKEDTAGLLKMKEEKPDEYKALLEKSK